MGCSRKSLERYPTRSRLPRGFAGRGVAGVGSTARDQRRATASSCAGVSEQLSAICGDQRGSLAGSSSVAVQLMASGATRVKRSITRNVSALDPR